MFNSISGLSCILGLIVSVTSDKLITTSQGWILGTVFLHVYFYNVIDASIYGANMSIYVRAADHSCVEHNSFPWQQMLIILLLRWKRPDNYSHLRCERPTFNPICFLYSPDCSAAAHLTDGRWKEEEQGDKKRWGWKLEKRKSYGGRLESQQRGGGKVLHIGGRINKWILVSMSFVFLYQMSTKQLS